MFFKPAYTKKVTKVVGANACNLRVTVELRAGQALKLHIRSPPASSAFDVTRKLVPTALFLHKTILAYVLFCIKYAEIPQNK